MKIAQLCPTLCDPMDYTVHRILQARILEWVASIPPPGDLPNPGIKPRSPTLQADSLPTEPQGTPKNTRVGGLSLHQRIFPIQDLNQCLLHFRQILYQLSYKGKDTYFMPGTSMANFSLAPQNKVFLAFRGWLHTHFENLLKSVGSLPQLKVRHSAHRGRGSSLRTPGINLGCFKIFLGTKDFLF